MAKLTLVCTVAGLLASACGTRKNPEFCINSTDCADPAKPFCDINGDFGDLMNDCIAQPPVDASIDGAGDAGQPLPDGKHGCTTGEPVSCSDDNLNICAEDGQSTNPVSCALGCDMGTLTCLTFVPSHGLAPAMNDAAAQPDISIPSGSRLDTDTGAVVNAGGGTISVASQVVSQSGGPPIRVFLARSFTIDDVVVTGSAALAFVSPGAIKIVGRLDASAHTQANGPGAVTTGSTCVGTATQNVVTGQTTHVPGSGGGGHATTGGAGGPDQVTLGGAGGQARSEGGSLVGGCAGGTVTFHATPNNEVETGGGGGGAVQIDSLTSVSFSSRGGIQVGGGGGVITAVGGGAGGTVVIEAPTVTLSGSSTGIVANGGGGGACGSHGDDGSFTTSPAASPVCSTEVSSGGHGGTALSAAASATSCRTTTGCSSEQKGGGGGGAVGTLSIATRDGTFELASSPVMSASTTASSLVAVPSP